MTLVQRLAGLSEDDQGATARAEVGTAAIGELLDALDLEPLGEWARLHIVDELSQRGAAIVPAIAHRLAERPARPAGRALAEALTELFRRASQARPAIVRALTSGGEAALERGGVRSAATYIVHLADCARLAGQVPPEARQLARAYLDGSAGEGEPDRFTMAEAAFLTGEAGAGGDNPR